VTKNFNPSMIRTILVCFATQNKGGMWKELTKCLVDDLSNVWSADLSQRHKSDDFNSLPHAPVLLKDKQL
jgi:hypothetical protein